MINTPRPQPVRRLALAGVLTAAVLAGGAGVAYATSTGAQPVETGYATVVEEGSRSVEGSAADCPERGSGGGSGEAPSQTTEQAPRETPEQNPTPEGDL